MNINRKTTINFDCHEQVRFANVEIMLGRLLNRLPNDKELVISSATTGECFTVEELMKVRGILYALRTSDTFVCN